MEKNGIDEILDNFISEELDLLCQTVNVRSKTFARDRKVAETFSSIIPSEEREISRKSVFDAFDRSGKEGILTAFAWGFPNGGRGKAKAVANNMCRLETIIRHTSLHGIDERTFNLINKIPKLNFATTTKFFYFSKSKIDGMEALIFDNRVKRFLERMQFREYNEMLPYLKIRSGYGIPFQYYATYVRATHRIAQRRSVLPATIELCFYNQIQEAEKRRMIYYYPRVAKK